MVGVYVDLVETLKYFWMMGRKKINEEIRRQVYNKYNGHCAYCGCELEYKNMQVDHLDSVYRAEAEGRVAEESLDNYMPACRQCNFYKGTFTIEGLRRKLMNFNERLMTEFSTRLAQKYGMLNVQWWDGKFYFEKEESNGN